MKAFTKYIAYQFGKPTGLGGIISTFIMNVINRKQYKSVIDNISCEKDYKVLDIGFGNGYFIKKLAALNDCQIFGVEISQDMVHLAEKKNKKMIEKGKLHLSLGDVSQLPFEDNYFDRIYTINTIYFWQDINKGLSEVSRVLKPNGLFMNVVYSKKWLDNLKYTNYGFSKYEIQDMVDIFKSNNFEIVENIEIETNKSFCTILRKK